jgi:hypothetical protein
MTSPHPTPGARRGGVRERFPLDPAWVQIIANAVHARNEYAIAMAMLRSNGGLLRTARGGMGLREFARAIEVSPSYLSKVENGEARLTGGLIERIYRHLKELPMRRPPGARGKKEVSLAD